LTSFLIKNDIGYKVTLNAIENKPEIKRVISKVSMPPLNTSASHRHCDL